MKAAITFFIFYSVTEKNWIARNLELQEKTQNWET